MSSIFCHYIHISSDMSDFFFFFLPFFRSFFLPFSYVLSVFFSFFLFLSSSPFSFVFLLSPSFNFLSVFLLFPSTYFTIFRIRLPFIPGRGLRPKKYLPASYRPIYISCDLRSDPTALKDALKGAELTISGRGVVGSPKGVRLHHVQGGFDVLRWVALCLKVRVGLAGTFGHQGGYLLYKFGVLGFQNWGTWFRKLGVPGFEN